MGNKQEKFLCFKQGYFPWFWDSDHRITAQTGTRCSKAKSDVHALNFPWICYKIKFHFEPCSFVHLLVDSFYNTDYHNDEEMDIVKMSENLFSIRLLCIVYVKVHKAYIKLEWQPSSLRTCHTVTKTGMNK